MYQSDSFRHVGAIQKLIVAAVCLALASSCAIDPKTGRPSFKEMFASDDPCSSNARNIGIGIGAVLGMVIGNQVKHSNSARVMGGVAGAMVGGLIGADMDRRRCELTKIAKQNNLDMQFEEIKTSQMVDISDSQVAAATPKKPDGPDQLVGMKVSLKDNGQQFMSGSEELTPEALAYFSQIADQYSYEQQKKLLSPSASKEDTAAIESLKSNRVLLIGHTDDTGSSTLNADLSERRAMTVAKVFEERGISQEQLFFQGAGETLPMADNRTEDGRAKNRRVEIIDLTDDITLQGYLAARKPALAYYRNSPANVTTASIPHVAETKVPDAPGTKQMAKNSVSSESSRKGSPVDPRTSPSLNQKAKTRSKSVTSAPAANMAVVFDFGGEPVGNRLMSVDIGNLPSTSGVFSIISSAHADEPMAGSCAQDRPRISHGVKSLKDGKEFSSSDYLPGHNLYDTSWADMVNGQLVTLQHVAVLRDGGAPARRPQLQVYRDYKGNVGAKPSYSSVPEVNTYRGDKAVLYRVFVNGPMRCMDIVIPNRNPVEAPESQLYFDRGQTLYTASFNPKVAK